MCLGAMLGDPPHLLSFSLSLPTTHCGRLYGRVIALFLFQFSLPSPSLYSYHLFSSLSLLVMEALRLHGSKLLGLNLGVKNTYMETQRSPTSLHLQEQGALVTHHLELKTWSPLSQAIRKEVAHLFKLYFGCSLS